MIDNTLHLTGESRRKQLKLSAWAVSALKQGEEYSLTKGLAANEALLLANDDISDPLTDIEADVDRRLNEATGSNVAKLVEEIQKHDDLRTGLALLREKCEYADPDDASTTTDVYLLGHICDWLPARGANEVIEDALVHVASTPWNSRTERIHAKQQLARFAESGARADDLHPVVDDIIEGESITWDVESVHCAVVTPDNWWESDDITEQDLHERGDEIPQKPRDHKIRAIQTVVGNKVAEGVPVKEAYVVHLATLTGVSEDTAKQYYVPEISLGRDAVHVTAVGEVLHEHAEKLRTELSSERLARLPSTDATIIGFDRDVVSIDKQYPTPEAARDALQRVVDGDFDRDDLDGQIDAVVGHHQRAVKHIATRAERGEF